MDNAEQKKIKMIYQNRVNRANGALFESLIEEACDNYWARGLAHIEKNAEPFTVTRPLGKGQFIGHFAKAGQPDYKGVLVGGRAVCFEAKHTENDRIKQDAVMPHQADSLRSHSKMGAVCFVLVSIGQHFYKVPWDAWENMKELCGHKYMTAQELQPYKVPLAKGKIDFLHGIL